MAAITVDYRGNSGAESASNEILSNVVLSASFILLSLVSGPCLERVSKCMPRVYYE